MDKSALDQLAAMLLLISPFFFWGTSMVAFKACIFPIISALRDSAPVPEAQICRAHGW